MTIIAGVTAENMIGSFTLCLDIIVAGGASTRDRGMVHTGVSPGKFSMAIVAAITALDVVWTLLGGCNRTGGTMTTLTTGRSALENTVCVAGFATDPGMRTVEQKAGGVMIKMGCREAAVYP